MQLRLMYVNLKEKHLFLYVQQKGQRMERLISQARKGDPDAFTALMESQMQNMYKAARSVLCNDEDIADAISDTILVCWEKFSQLKEDRYFSYLDDQDPAE